MLDTINGYESGYNSGISEGIRKNNKQIVKQMKKEKIDIKTISKITGLTEEEIKQID